MRMLRCLLKLHVFALFAFVLILPSVAGAAYNDKFGKAPITCYALDSGRVVTYDKPGGKQIGWIDGAADQIFLQDIYASGWIYGRYPTSRGNKYAYFKLDRIFAEPNFGSFEAGVIRDVSAYRKSNTNQTIGTIYANDKITVVGYSGNRAQVVYPVSGGYKMGWINKSQIKSDDNRKTDVVKYPTGAVKYPANGWYRISPVANTNASLDVSAANKSSGANIQLWSSVDVPQQKFYLEHRGNGYYTIKSGHCDMYVDAQGGNPYAGENVWQYSYNGTNAQMWRFIDAGNGAFYIESKMQPGLSFDCAGGRTSNGTNVQLWVRENVAWHKWRLVGVDAPEKAVRYPLSNTYVCGNNWGTYYARKDGKHLGIDITSNSGDKNVYAAASGTVVQTGWNSENGNTITIRHEISGKTVYSFYGHLAQVNTSAGKAVSKGTKIGVVGNTGNSSEGEHLHFAVTTQKTAGTWGYGTVNGNVGSRNGNTFYNPHYVIEHGSLP